MCEIIKLSLASREIWTRHSFLHLFIHSFLIPSIHNYRVPGFLTTCSPNPQSWLPLLPNSWALPWLAHAKLLAFELLGPPKMALTHWLFWGLLLTPWAPLHSPQVEATSPAHTLLP